LRLTGQTRAQRDQAFDLGLIGDLEVEMNPRSMIAALLVYVSITIWWFEAPKFWMLGPLIAQLPTQRRRPEVRAFLRDIGPNVEEDVQPLRSLYHHDASTSSARIAAFG
jgi:hypothetical protein